MKFGVANGSIDINTIQTDYDMSERKRYLAMHNYKIWQGKDGGFYTYLPDKDFEKERRLIRKSNQKTIEDVVVNYYKEKDKEPNIHDVFYSWLDEKLELKEICNGTYDRYESDYERFIKDTEFEKLKLSEVSEEILEMFIRKSIAQKELTVKGYSKLRTIIMGMFKYAKRKKYTQMSISTFFKDLDISSRAFVKNYKPKESQVFMEDEIPLLIKWLKEHPTVENLGVLLVFQTGIREGELSGLKYSDVSGKKLKIQRQEIKYKDRENNKRVHEIVEYTKTDAGLREILLTDKALETIRGIRKLNPFNEYMMQVGSKKIWTNTFNDRLYDACDGCGIPRRSMHKIRKTYGTTLIDSGADESLIQSQMGHADISTTRKFYYFGNKNDSTNQAQIDRAISW